MASRRLRFLNPDAAPPKPPGSLQLAGDILTAVWPLAAWLVAITIGSAVIYFIGTQKGWGIQPTFVTSAIPSGSYEVTFYDCLHFSVVSVTTLGYGDFRPESYGRAVAAMEVLIGLVLMGLFVSRLVSRQQDRRTKRLVHGQLNSEIQNFRNQLSVLLNEFRQNQVLLVLTGPSATLYRASGIAQSIARYWRHEARQSDLAEIIPRRAASRLLGDLSVLLEMVKASVGDKHRSEIHWEDIKYIRNVTESALVAATALVDRVSGRSIEHIYANIAASAKLLRQQLELHKSYHVYPSEKGALNGDQ